MRLCISAGPITSSLGVGAGVGVGVGVGDGVGIGVGLGVGTGVGGGTGDGGGVTFVQSLLLLHFVTPSFPQMAPLPPVG